MGQPISVTRKATSRPDTVRFETNRVLTGMAHERYTASEHIEGNRPPDEIAKRFLDRGDVKSVHVYSNIVEATLEPGANVDELEQILRDLYIHYLPGVTPSITA
jgi:hypothetical protein